MSKYLAKTALTNAIKAHDICSVLGAIEHADQFATDSKELARLRTLTTQYGAELMLEALNSVLLGQQKSLNLAMQMVVQSRKRVSARSTEAEPERKSKLVSAS